jgi:isoleucyl-tRNA synthetase
VAILIAGVPPADAFTLDDVPGIGVVPKEAEGGKCARCWQVLPDVGNHGHDEICGRCTAAVDKLPNAAE